MKTKRRRCHEPPPREHRRKRGGILRAEGPSKAGADPQGARTLCDGEDWKKTLRLADLSREMISPRVLNTAEVMAKMPAVVCGSDGSAAD